MASKQQDCPKSTSTDSVWVSVGAAHGYGGDSKAAGTNSTLVPWGRTGVDRCVSQALNFEELKFFISEQ